MSALFTPYPQNLSSPWQAVSAQLIFLEGIKSFLCSEEVTLSQHVGEAEPWSPCLRNPPGSFCPGLESSDHFPPSWLQLGRPWALTPGRWGDLLQAGQQVDFRTPNPHPDPAPGR